MKRINLIFWLLVLYSASLTAQSFKVVGYLPSYRSNLKIEYNKLTHLCLSFVNPSNSEGTLTHNFSNLSTIVTKAHEENVKILISIGGGGLSSEMEENYSTLMKLDNRADFITKLLDFLKDNKLDGLDVDLEGDLVLNTNYNDFVIALGDSIKSRNSDYLLTAAYTTWNADNVSDKALTTFDFINSMSYDACGPTWGVKGCNHSTYDRAKSDQSYWVSKRNIDKSRFILGVPFYGIDWNTNEYITYSQVLSTYPNDIDNDTANDGKVVYNGKQTIQKKTQFALKNGGGIMIWEIGQDAIGNTNSLLNVIHNQVLLPITKKQSSIFELYPNPASNHLLCQLKIQDSVQIIITDILGKQIYNEVVLTNKTIDLTSFEEGIYIVHVYSKNQQQTQKIRVVKG